MIKKSFLLSLLILIGSSNIYSFNVPSNMHNNSITTATDNAINRYTPKQNYYFVETNTNNVTAYIRNIASSLKTSQQDILNSIGIIPIELSVTNNSNDNILIDPSEIIKNNITINDPIAKNKINRSFLFSRIKNYATSALPAHILTALVATGSYLFFTTAEPFTYLFLPINFATLFNSLYRHKNTSKDLNLLKKNLDKTFNNLKLNPDQVQQPLHTKNKFIEIKPSKTYKFLLFVTNETINAMKNSQVNPELNFTYEMDFLQGPYTAYLTKRSKMYRIRKFFSRIPKLSFS